MESEDNDKSIGFLQPNDDPRPGFYHAYREAEFDYIMARNRQKYAEEKYENLKRKYKQPKLGFDEEHALGEDLKSAVQSLMSSEKRQGSWMTCFGFIAPVQWSASKKSSAIKLPNG